VRPDLDVRADMFERPGTLRSGLASANRFWYPDYRIKFEDLTLRSCDRLTASPWDRGYIFSSVAGT